MKTHSVGSAATVLGVNGTAGENILTGAPRVLDLRDIWEFVSEDSVAYADLVIRTNSKPLRLVRIVHAKREVKKLLRTAEMKAHTVESVLRTASRLPARLNAFRRRPPRYTGRYQGP